MKEILDNKELVEAVKKYARSSDRVFSISELQDVLEKVRNIETDNATINLKKQSDINFLMLLIDNYEQLGGNFGSAYIEKIKQTLGE